MRFASLLMLAVTHMVGSPALAQEHAGNGGGQMAEMDKPPQVSMAGPLGLPEQRNGSGTSWQPDSTPMFAWFFPVGGWTLMLHTSVFAGYDAQGGDRGDDKVLSANWVMGMARHELAEGELGVRAMFSLDPLTVGGNGYPLLLQTGESFQGIPLHDRQHPHDLFMEVAALYRRTLGDSVAFELYAAPVGEPALGPTAFPHRISAMSDPLAPLGHHWQDSTHISFGVVTAGVFTRRVKLEGSWFNGREPDEDRYDFDIRAPDSFAGRLSVNPRQDLSAQVSYGYLKSPEALEPDQSLRRVTASATWNTRPAGDGELAVTAVWGRNIPENGTATDAFLVEGNLGLAGHHAIFARGELVTKSGRDLVLPAAQESGTFRVGSVVVGYVYDFAPIAGIVPGIGVRGSLNFVGDGLEPFYGSRTPVGAMVYVTVHAPEMMMGHSAGMLMPMQHGGDMGRQP